MDKIKILVAQHKQVEVYKNNVYMPIHVGKALHPELNLGIQTDDTGDNISALNPMYCELTAQYWAWKNLHNVEYIGLCHYRRYFEKEFTEDNVESILDGNDVILSSKYYFRSNILNWQFSTLTPEDVTIFYLYLKRRFAANKEKFETYFLKQNWIHPANMFVCKKDVFDKFCEWQFDILDDLKSLILPSPYSRERRILGYFAEALLPFFFHLNNYKIKEIPLVSMIGEKTHCYDFSFVPRMKENLLFTKGHQKFVETADIIGGLKNDGILDKINTLLKAKGY
ncbi:MAG: DUF4422 domain-containing protein [Fibrobacter sp.]|uniref:DUF4422 domain-containing protein n=1 Tax=Fibrobacter sp. TaxID=35828 RepID=UPI0025C740AF|nr:DUF4422 domain-containing protein [Fibrobacter sp.]MBQ7081692.1 DUF4422 domain-containing protein [Fibrobacter sp.]